MTKIENVLYTAHARTTGGRDTARQTGPSSRLSRGNIDVEINLI